MQPLYKRIALMIFVLMVMIQIFPGDRPEVSFDNPDDIHTELLIDQDVSNILKTSCYDCHSNETKYPWYTGVSPFSWLVNHDIEEGRGELNFSEWASFSNKRKHHKLEEIIEEVEEGEMPMGVYTVIHRNAELSEEKMSALIAWAKTEMAKIEGEK